MSLFNFFKKSKKEFSKSLAIYVSSELNKILIAPHYIDESWLRYEQEEIKILKFDCTDSAYADNQKIGFMVKKCTPYK